MTRGDFVLDRFQVEACAAIDAGLNVLVAAPTGAGKTVVAEHAAAAALDQGGRAFYTTPIKALSNQKYQDLVAVHGADNVGLLTGDNAHNPDAGVVVMTTEVLRNMAYARSPALDRLAWVILDEVHYLQDPYRGPVWEEVIVHTPPQVRFACLSATVSNADELAGWIESARGPTATVVETTRPVELVNHYLVYDKGSGDLVQVQTLVDGRANPDAAMFDSPTLNQPRQQRHKQRSRHRWGSPRRPEVAAHLAANGLLPAICFVFSRKGCEEAARSVLESGLRLTDRDERAQIRAIVHRHVSHLGREDLEALGFERFSAGMEAGVASHHAGMVPPFKEAVEACFVAGLVKLVFATETLALGINMPARSVVIESLSKFTGEHHEDLTPSQYTQLTGRAGRRGLDPVGHALVLWSPWQGFDTVAALASSREFVLRSAFQPTYNMVVNLVLRYDRNRAHELLGLSFAQYQADQTVGKVAHRRARLEASEADAAERATCSHGDIDAYRDLRADERRQARKARDRDQQALAEQVGELAPGDVIAVAGQRLCLLSVAHRRAGVRLKTVDVDAELYNLDAAEFDSPPERLATISLPQPFDPADRAAQRRVAAQLRKVRLRQEPGRRSRRPAADGGASAAAEHPVASCPQLTSHLDAARDRDRLRRRLQTLEQEQGRASSSLTSQFDRIESLLAARGFLDGWALTERGEILARIFHESDLLTATVIADGLLDGLDVPTLAGLVSMLTYEHRSKEPPPPPWYPSCEVRKRATAIEVVGAALAKAEDRARLPQTRQPDPSFLALAYAWAAGESFSVVIEEEDLSGGDFVRNIKQLIDVLRQVAEVAPDPDTAATAGQAAEALFRGIVSSSSEVGGSDGPVLDDPVSDIGA